MRLKHVEIYGFKSFAQRTELSFDKGITGIVGPNGSGKSNIADAVRWVLGEQSAKTLRGTRMEDVIFNGTQTRKPLPYCEVSLLFDNEDGALNSPFAEVMVTRRVYRSGEGEYYLNKNSCRLRDLLELFRDTGIGKEGYSIIGQGRIEEILSAKGEERRGVFEEAAGIVTFRVRKEEAERKLARTKENLLRVGDLLDEIAGRLGPLEEQAKTAQEYLALSENLKSLELNVFLVRHDRLKERLASLQRLGEEMASAIAGHEEELKRLSAERQELDRALEAMGERDEAARQAQRNAQSEQFRKQSALNQEETKLSSLIQSLRDLSTQAEDLRARISEMEGLIAQGLSAGQVQEELISQAKAACESQRSVLAKAEEAVHQAEETLDAHRQRILSLMNRLSDVKSAQARQQAMLTQMEARREEIAEERASLKENIQAQAGRVTDAEKQYQAVREQVAGLESEQKALEDTLKKAAAHEEAIGMRLRENGNKAQDVKSRLDVLEEMARAYEGYGLAVKRALQRAKGNSDVHGVVAQLIQVPEIYETAIEMILGGSLQHIVTSDEESAKELIDYLRENRLGRATFLPISAVRGRLLSNQERQLLSMPGCKGVASELIGFKEAHRGVMESLLGRTVIVEDLNAAIVLSRKARQSFTVVTLLGDVMRAGGAMTGGTAQSRTVSLLGREREIKGLRERLKQLEQALEKDQLALAEAMNLTADAKHEQEQAAQTLSDERIALARETERLQHAKDAHEQALKRDNALDDALSQLEEAMAEIRQDLAGASQQTEDAQIDRQGMEEETLRLQGLLYDARAVAESEREKLDQLQDEQTRLLHEQDIHSRDHARMDKDLQSLKETLDKNEQTTERTQRDKDQAETLILKLKDELQEAEKAAQEKQDALSALEKERAQLMGRQRACVDASDALHARHQQDTDKLHRNELVQSRTQSELSAIADYVFTSYELTYAGAEAFRVEGKFELPKAELEITAIKQRIREMGTVNVNAIEDLAATTARYKEMNAQREDALRAQDDLERLIDELLNQMAKQFVSEFDKLNAYFSETFSRLFDGGQAELILTDKSQPLTCDIEVAAQPPGKKLQLLSLLSGGERALTAIAILFAMLKLKPTPFCILDEIEAALDEANIGYFADYLSEYARSTQFIVITHRKGTMERCDSLYGVAMEEKGISSMVSVDLMQYA